MQMGFVKQICTVSSPKQKFNHYFNTAKPNIFSFRQAWLTRVHAFSFVNIYFIILPLMKLQLFSYMIKNLRMIYTKQTSSVKYTKSDFY